MPRIWSRLALTWRCFNNLINELKIKIFDLKPKSVLGYPNPIPSPIFSTYFWYLFLVPVVSTLEIGGTTLLPTFEQGDWGVGGGYQDFPVLWKGISKCLIWMRVSAVTRSSFTCTAARQRTALKISQPLRFPLRFCWIKTNTQVSVLGTLFLIPERFIF